MSHYCMKTIEKRPISFPFTYKSASCLVRRCLQIPRQKNIEGGKIGQENDESPNRNGSVIRMLLANLYMSYIVRSVNDAIYNIIVAPSLTMPIVFVQLFRRYDVWRYAFLYEFRC